MFDAIEPVTHDSNSSSRNNLLAEIFPNELKQGNSENVIEKNDKINEPEDVSEQTDNQKRDTKTITDIILNKGDFWHGYKNQLIKNALTNAAKKGVGSVDQLVKGINRRLTEKGSNLRMNHNFSGKGYHDTLPDERDLRPGEIHTLEARKPTEIFRYNDFHVELKNGKNIEDRIVIKPPYSIFVG